MPLEVVVLPRRWKAGSGRSSHPYQVLVEKQVFRLYPNPSAPAQAHVSYELALVPVPRASHGELRVLPSLAVRSRL